MNTILKNPTVLAATAHLLSSATPLRTKNAGDPLDLLAKKFGEHVSEVLTKLGATNEQLEGVKAQLDEMEQKAARGNLGESGRYGSGGDSVGEQFVGNGELKTFADYRSRPSRLSMSIKTTITTGSTSAGALTRARRDGEVLLPQVRLTVRDLIPTIQIREGSVEYPRQLTRSTAAAMVAEGQLKPEGATTWEMKTAVARVIAHWIPASRQILDDAPQLRGIIDNDLMYGLKLKEEEQLLYGSNTGENLQGLVTLATPYAAPFTPAGTVTLVDQIGLAILQNALANYPADGVILNPSDWMRIQLLKDAGGNYIVGDPSKGTTQGGTSKQLFGVPIIDTPAMTIDKFLVGNFRAAATIYDRWDARVEVSTEHADFFVRNLVAILCEERIAQAVKVPAALTYGDFGLVP